MDISALFAALPGDVAQGIIWGIMALGVFFTFRILDFADLTVDGSFATGGAVAAMLITNGYAVPITWKKDNRAGKTKYYYKDGQQIEVSDGRTYIELQTNTQKVTIE